jgi:hypothetical protein
VIVPVSAWLHEAIVVAPWNSVTVRVLPTVLEALYEIVCVAVPGKVVGLNTISHVEPDAVLMKSASLGETSSTIA